jgi:2-dehydro-3-deoxyglucarate aldolase
MKNIKEVIKGNGYAIGSWINTVSPIVAEIMAASNFDFLVVDAEHSAVDIESSISIFQAIAAGNQNCVPMVRMAGNNYSDTKRFLDAGALGVIAPLINTAKEAEYLVESVKYPPLGKRGVGYGRSHGYGFDFDDYMKKANKDTFVCVQVEHVDAIENLDDMFSTKGVDAAFIGPYDLSASMGLTAQFQHKRYVEAYRTILKKCKEHKIIPGIHVVQPDADEVLKRIDEGFQFIAYSLDITIIGHFSRMGLNAIRGRK